MNRQELQNSFEETLSGLSLDLEKRASGLPVLYSQKMSLDFGGKDKKKMGARLTPMGEPKLSLMPLLAEKSTKPDTSIFDKINGIDFKVKRLNDDDRMFKVRDPVATAGVRGFQMPMPEMS